MKKIMMVVVLAMGFVLFGQAPEARADIAREMDLGIGGHMFLGGTNNSQFTFGLVPQISFAPIDNLQIFSRLPFWMGNFHVDDSDFQLHVFPFLFGAKYNIKLMDKLYFYPALAMGFSILHSKTNVASIAGFSVPGVSGTSTTVRFTIDFQSGIQYEIMDNLAFDGGLDIMIYNVEGGATVAFGVMGGVIYYLPL